MLPDRLETEKENPKKEGDRKKDDTHFTSTWLAFELCGRILPAASCVASNSIRPRKPT